MAIRFVHAADLHLDSPFVGLSATAPAAVSEALLDATFAAYRRLIDLCLAEHAEALLVAGDVYDGADRSLRAQRAFYVGLNRLSEAGIRSFVCHGNHDHLGGWEANLDAPALCHRFGASVEAVPFDPSRPERGTVYGISYPRQEVRENLAALFSRTGPGLAIGLLHANVGGFGEHANYAPCTVDDLASTGMDYWALGHVHTRAVLRDQRPAVVYPGNPQGRHPYETGPRGAYLVDIDDDGTVALDFRELDVVRWARIDVPIDGLEREQDLLDAADGALDAALGESGDRPLASRLRFTGRGPMHTTLQRPGLLTQLHEQLNETWSGRSPFAWVERVETATAASLDREQLKAGHDFVADLLTLVDDIVGDDERIALLRNDLQPLYLNDRARRYLADAVPGEAELREILAAAESLCLDRLLAQEA